MMLSEVLNQRHISSSDGTRNLNCKKHLQQFAVFDCSLNETLPELADTLCIHCFHSIDIPLLDYT